MAEEIPHPNDEKTVKFAASGRAAFRVIWVDSSLAALERRETDPGHSLIKPGRASNACRGREAAHPLSGSDHGKLLFVQFAGQGGYRRIGWEGEWSLSQLSP